MIVNERAGLPLDGLDKFLDFFWTALDCFLDKLYKMLVSVCRLRTQTKSYTLQTVKHTGSKHKVDGPKSLISTQNTGFRCQTSPCVSEIQRLRWDCAQSLNCPSRALSHVCFIDRCIYSLINI